MPTLRELGYGCTGHCTAGSGDPCGDLGLVEDRWALLQVGGVLLTKLEVGVVGADVIAGAQQALHHEGRAHGVEQAEVLGDPTLLLGAERAGEAGRGKEGA